MTSPVLPQFSIPPLFTRARLEYGASHRGPERHKKFTNFWVKSGDHVKTVVFIAGKKNPAIQKKIIRFSIENLIANISF